MNSIPQSSGVYKITCTANGKIYVGSAKNLRERWRGHRKALRRGDHHSIHLQNAWNKYGKDSFTFEIIELVMPWSRIDREQYWLDKLKPYNQKNGFNIAKIAEPFGEPQVFTAERKAKMSAKMKGNQHVKGRKMSVEERAERSRTANRTFTKEHKANISAAKMGHTTSPETLIKLSESHCKKIYILISPSGEEFVVKRLKLFCKEHNLTDVCLYGVLHGKQKHHKGWIIRIKDE